jgi:hypothetical protein
VLGAGKLGLRGELQVELALVGLGCQQLGERGLEVGEERAAFTFLLAEVADVLPLLCVFDEDL